MLIDAYASRSHYAEHIAPVWAELSEQGAAGEWCAPRSGRWWGERASQGWLSSTRPMLVASLVDAQKVAPRPYVYLEHGAGQVYPGDPRSAGHGSYSGGSGHERAILFLCPSETVAGRWRAIYPSTPAVTVGCPRLDRWHRDPPHRSTRPPTVAFSFRWPNGLIPETESALGHYRHHLRRLVGDMRASGLEMLGHGHPRAAADLWATWQALGVDTTRSFDDVLARADLLAVDNSSAGPEFASTGRPIVWLNAPWYRRDIHHGGRFWDWTHGIATVDDPHQLASALTEALTDPPGARHAREQMVAAVYAHRDGYAAQRAAEAAIRAAQENAA